LYSVTVICNPVLRVTHPSVTTLPCRASSDMKFSVEVQTDCQTYDRNRVDSPAARHLNWDIIVDIHQHSIQFPKEKADAQREMVTARKMGVVHSAPALPPASSQVGKIEKQMRDTECPRKTSKLDREDELVRMAMRKASRKVSREGEWLVIREKTGLLTTQNGTQQIRETRVRINEDELSKLCELNLI